MNKRYIFFVLNKPTTFQKDQFGFPVIFATGFKHVICGNTQIKFDLQVACSTDSFFSDHISLLFGSAWNFKDVHIYFKNIH